MNIQQIAVDMKKILHFKIVDPYIVCAFNKFEKCIPYILPTIPCFFPRRLHSCPLQIFVVPFLVCTYKWLEHNQMYQYAIQRYSNWIILNLEAEVCKCVQIHFKSSVCQILSFRCFYNFAIFIVFSFSSSSASLKDVKFYIIKFRFTLVLRKGW